MAVENWDKEAGYAVTVCNKEGVVVYQNAKAAKTFEKYGEIVGKNLMDCHNSHSRAKIEQMLETGDSNTYTIEKNGVKKLIHQTPRIENGEITGLIELSIELPESMPHFKRD